MAQRFTGDFKHAQRLDDAPKPHASAATAATAAQPIPQKKEGDRADILRHHRKQKDACSYYSYEDRETHLITRYVHQHVTLGAGSEAVAELYAEIGNPENQITIRKEIKCKLTHQYRRGGFFQANAALNKRVLGKGAVTQNVHDLTTRHDMAVTYEHGVSLRDEIKKPGVSNKDFILLLIGGMQALDDFHHKHKAIHGDCNFGNIVYDAATDLFRVIDIERTFYRSFGQPLTNRKKQIYYPPEIAKNGSVSAASFDIYIFGNVGAEYVKRSALPVHAKIALLAVFHKMQAQDPAERISFSMPIFQLYEILESILQCPLSHGMREHKQSKIAKFTKEDYFYCHSLPSDVLHNLSDELLSKVVAGLFEEKRFDVDQVLSVLDQRYRRPTLLYQRMLFCLNDLYRKHRQGEPIYKRGCCFWRGYSLAEKCQASDALSAAKATPEKWEQIIAANGALRNERLGRIASRLLRSYKEDVKPVAQKHPTRNFYKLL